LLIDTTNEIIIANKLKFVKSIQMKFTELQLDELLLEAISYMGFETAMPIQEKVIPVILENRDLIACSQTGSGKT